MSEMKEYPLSDVVDEIWGVKGTPERDKMEMELKEELHSYFASEAKRRN